MHKNYICSQALSQTLFGELTELTRLPYWISEGSICGSGGEVQSFFKNWLWVCIVDILENYTIKIRFNNPFCFGVWLNGALPSLMYWYEIAFTVRIKMGKHYIFRQIFRSDL